MILSSPFIAATNHLLARAPWARERLAPHAERHARLKADPVTIDFAVTSAGTLAAAACDAPEVTLQVSAGEIPRLLLGDMEHVMRGVRIEGNAEFADALGFVFRNLRWDVEEDLSRVVGDIAAHRLVKTGEALRDANARAWNSIAGNVGEYLSEESRLLLTRNIAETHHQALQALRDDLARLEKRVERLASSAGGVVDPGTRGASS